MRVTRNWIKLYLFSKILIEISSVFTGRKGNLGKEIPKLFSHIKNWNGKYEKICMN